MVKNTHFILLTVCQHVSKQIIFGRKRVMVLKMINNLLLPVKGQEVKHDLSTPRSPFEVKEFGECRCLFLPIVLSSCKYSLND